MPFEFCDRVARRGFVKAGLTGFAGLGLPQLLQLQAAAPSAKTRNGDTAVIYLELAGGPSQHETYDPKPDAPAEYRGPLKPTKTSVSGVLFCELMAEQAKILDKLVILRAVHHNSGSHQTSAHLTQTGYYLRDRQSRANDMPCIGSVAARVCGANEPGVPPFVSIPNSMRYGRAAWIGKGFNPFETNRSADKRPFEVPNLTLVGGLTQDRLTNRRSLLSGFDKTREILDNNGVADAQNEFTRQAFDMVTGDKARAAFDIAAEPEAVRRRYGKSSIGQNLLLARRLVEAGVKFVSVRVNTLGSWDDHNRIEKRMKAKGPAFDQGVAALISELHERGMNRNVLVVAMGEFGRTPRVNPNAGRDHWGRVMSVMMAGGNLNTGQVIGSSDSQGGVPVDRPYRPENILATVYGHMGIDPATTFTDNSGRPRYLLEERTPIET